MATLFFSSMVISSHPDSLNVSQASINGHGFVGNDGRFILLRPRWGEHWQSLFGGQLVNEVGDESGPARLV